MAARKDIVAITGDGGERLGPAAPLASGFFAILTVLVLTLYFLRGSVRPESRTSVTSNPRRPRHPRLSAAAQRPD